MHEKQGAAERDQGFPQLAAWHRLATHAGRPVGLRADTTGWGLTVGLGLTRGANNCDAETSCDAERVNQLSFSCLKHNSRRITASKTETIAGPVNHKSEQRNWKRSFLSDNCKNTKTVDQLFYCSYLSFMVDMITVLMQGSIQPIAGVIY